MSITCSLSLKKHFKSGKFWNVLRLSALASQRPTVFDQLLEVGGGRIKGSDRFPYILRKNHDPVRNLFLSRPLRPGQSRYMYVTNWSRTLTATYRRYVRTPLKPQRSRRMAIYYTFFKSYNYTVVYYTFVDCSFVKSERHTSQGEFFS